MHYRLFLGLVILAVGFCGCFGKMRGPEHFYFGSYSEAENLYSKGKYEEAIAKYQQYITENPGGNLTVISRYYIAKSEAALGNTQKAKEIYQAIINENPNLVWANFSKSQLKELESK